MSDPKLLTENSWKAVAAKFKIKDNGLQKALAIYEKLDEEKFDERTKAVGGISQFVAALKKDKATAAIPDVVKHLTNVASAAAAEQTEIAKAKAIAEKSAAAAAKKAEEAAKQGESEEDENEEGDYPVKLLATLQKLKSSKDLAFEFIVCDAKPFVGLMVAKKISSKHKDELSKLTGGSKRFLHPGTCHFEDGKFVFTMDQPPAGLAKRLQDAIKNFTGKKLPIKAGTESAEEEEEMKSAAGPAAATAPSPKLAKAPELWHGTRKILDANINKLKDAIRSEFANASPAMIAGIEKTVTKLDVVLEKLDHRLADSLAKAHATNDGAARQAELKNSQAILREYHQYVDSEPLIAHIDTNPFGIQTNLKHILGESLNHLEQAMK